MRYLIALVVLAAGAAAGVLTYRHLTAGPALVLPLPSKLVVAVNRAPLPPGEWSNSSMVTLVSQTGRPLVTGADFEVEPSGTPFRNKPTAVASDPSQVAENCKNSQGPSCAVATRSAPQVEVRLADGNYHWQVRLHNRDGISRWQAYASTIRVDTQPPSPPIISSSTDPNPKQTYHSSSLSFAWQSQDTASGVQGYSYRLDTNSHGTPGRQIRVERPAITLSGLQTGTYYFHAQAQDWAGNWGRVTTFPVHIDVTPPGLASVHFNEFVFNPDFSPLHVTFSLTRPAVQVHVGVYRQNTGQIIRLFRTGPLRAGQTTGVWWNGRDAIGRAAGPGTYKIYVRAIDRWEHSSLAGWNDFVVNERRIVVSLSQQHMWVYDGAQVVRQSPVTTGNKALPTPRGTYSIMARFHPFTFHSPWPKSSPYYYAPSKVQYALLFRDGGYFIHDAPWRSAFGPGTNAQLGTPGQNYTGTHGCINTPPDIAAWLYQWAPLGTVVQVVN